MSAVGKRWDCHREDDLRRRWVAGERAAVIGVDLGVSRNAVIGKAKRLGLPFHAQPASRALAYDFEAIRELARAIVDGEASIPVGASVWPEDEWLELIAAIQWAQGESGKPQTLPAPDISILACKPGTIRWGEPRLGQAEFRSAVLRNYGSRCAISGAVERASLEAAHIIPHADGGSFELSNGICLRADIHRLFDAGLLLVTVETLKVRIAPSVTCDVYRSLAGRTLAQAVRAPPNRAALLWRQRQNATR